MLFEDQALPTWNSRLVIPSFVSEPNLHTPKHFVGTFLPPVIKKNLTLSAEDNPVLLTTETHIASGITLTLNPGTHLLVSENVSLLVSGSFIVKGSENMPVVISSNEEHPQNQMWLGISVESGGVTTIEHAVIEDASPAVSCLKGSSTKITNTEIRRGTLGIFQEDVNCIIENSFINGALNGIVSTDATPQITNTTIHTAGEDLQEITSQ